MRRLRLALLVVLAAGALVVPSAQGVPAAGPGYVASFQVTYDSPPFPDARYRVTVSFSGDVCGDPFTSTWGFEATRTGGPSSPPPTLSPVTFAAANPINVTGDQWLDANGTEIARIEFIVRYTRGAAPTITPSWEATGDIQNVVATPTLVPVTARTLPDCSAAQPPPPPPGTAATGDRTPGRSPGTVKVPGSQRFVPIAEDQPLPSGTVVDVSQGRGIRLTSLGGDVLDIYGAPDGVPSQARLVRRGGLVELQLTGGSFKACAKRSLAGSSQAKTPVRRLWAKGSGKYRTRGRYAAGTIRGTWWLTEDSCTATLVRVREGSLTVRDFTKGRTLVIRAPKSYTATKRR